MCVSEGGNIRQSMKEKTQQLNTRQAALVEYIVREGYAWTERIAEHFKVSAATVHRDLVTLERAGLLRKVHGGAVSLAPRQEVDSPSERHFAQRMEVNRAAKQKIAEAAEKLVHQGDILFLDSSTTSLCLARRLQSSTLANLSIVTNSVLIAQEFHRFPSHFVLLCLGGIYNSQLNSFLGGMAIENLHKTHLTRAFFSGVGLDKNGLSTYYEEHAVFLREVLELAPENCLLLDSSKFGKAGLFNICPLKRIGQIISEQAIPVL